MTTHRQLNRKEPQAMPVFELEESTYAGPIPEDEILAAEITAIKDTKKPFKDDDGNDIPRVEFAFVIQDPESPWNEQRIWGDTPPTFTTNPSCKLFAWAQEILEADLSKGFVLDTDLLIGKRCRVVVAAKEYEKDGETKIRNYVKDVIRPKGGGAVSLPDDEEPF